MDGHTERGNVETFVGLSTQERKESRKGHDSQNTTPDGSFGRNQVDRVGSNDSGSDGVDMDNGRPISPGTLALMCDEQDFMAAGSPERVVSHGENINQKSLDGHGFTELFAEQERLVLTRLWDFLNRLITCGSIRGKFLDFIFPNFQFFQYNVRTSVWFFFTAKEPSYKRFSSIM